MMHPMLLVTLLLSLTSFTYANDKVTEQDKAPTSLRAHDQYIEGYISAWLDARYPDTPIEMHVEDGVAYIDAMPQDKAVEQELLTAMHHFPLAKSVEVNPDCYENCEQIKPCGVWFPEHVLMPAFIADPRRYCIGAQFRFHEPVVDNTAVEVTFGSQVPLYRWNNVGCSACDLEVGIEAGVFSLFDIEDISSPLINSDFLVAIPVTLRCHCWNFRFRLIHESSHLGDEFIVNNPDSINDKSSPNYRKNPSEERIDLFVTYNFARDFRVYAGYGYIFVSDNSFSKHANYIEYGFEAPLAKRCSFGQLCGIPFLALNMKHMEDLDWHGDANASLGFEFGRCSCLSRKFRVSLDYRKGYSRHGQFAKRKTEHVGMKISLGY